MYSEWEFFYAVVGQRAYVDVETPLVGSGSLRLVGDPAGPGAILGRWSQESNRGFRQGRVTTLIQPLAGVAGEDLYGVYGGAAQDDLSGTTGTAWGGAGRRSAEWEVRIVKVTAGWGSPLTVLQTLPVTMDFGATLGLQLRWLSESSLARRCASRSATRSIIPIWSCSPPSSSPNCWSRRRAKAPWRI